MLRTLRRGSRCIQHGISSRCVESSVAIRLSRSITEVTAASHFGANVPTVARDEARRIAVRRYICGRSGVTRRRTIQSGCRCTGSRAHYRFV